MNLLEIIEAQMKGTNEIILPPQKIEAFRNELKQLKLDKRNPSRLTGLARIKKEIAVNNLPFSIESKVKCVKGERITYWYIKHLQNNVVCMQNNVDELHEIVGKEYFSGKELYEMATSERSYEYWLQETVMRLQDELKRYQHDKEITARIENNKRWKEMFEPTPAPAAQAEAIASYDSNELTNDVFEHMRMMKFIDNMLAEDQNLKEHFSKLISGYVMDQEGYDVFMKQWKEGTH